MLQISELYIYPIKSLGGIAVNKATITDRGLQHDRRWMLVDEYNLFLSQRVVPEMALLQVSIESDGLRVVHKLKGDSLLIPFNAVLPEKREIVTIFDDTCLAEYVSKEADQWFTKTLDINCRLVRMPDDSRRPVDQRYAPGDQITSFSDGYPFLIIGQASLNELNSRLAEPLPINRFRPNIVFTGGEPFEEDTMGHLTINKIDFYGVKLCGRCPIPTLDQTTAQRGTEPLKTLATYRSKNHNVYFGQNLVHAGNGTIAVGDTLQVVSKNHDERFVINPVF